MIDETKLNELLAIGEKQLWYTWDADKVLICCHAAPEMAREIVELRRQLAEANEELEKYRAEKEEAKAVLVWYHQNGPHPYGTYTVSEDAAHRARVEGKE